MRCAGLLLLAGLAACDTDPCAGIAGTCLTLHVDPSSVRAVDQLDFDVTWGADHGTASARASAGETIELPAATAIDVGQSSAATLPLRVRVSGVIDGEIIGRAEVSLTLAQGEHASARLQLGLVPDGGAPDLTGGCTVGGLYCGGDKLEGDPNTLYRCTASGPVIRGACVAGCAVRPGRDDVCLGAGGPCVAPGVYCGGDKLPGDPQTLYRCDGTDLPPEVMTCAHGCKIRPGQDDACQ